ncbi:hypothetical protein LAT59_00355, partial [Candidatus Gracilibacteria bacterium]|nr:hypothetical protein [Candidatus Gracilibacteria bacterium]
MKSEKQIKEQLDCIDKVIKSGDIDHMLAILPIIHSIQATINQTLTSDPSPIARRTRYVIGKVINLIPEGKDEIEGTFLKIQDDTELLIVSGGVIAYIGEHTYLLPCTENELKSIGFLIKNNNRVPVKQGNQNILTALRKMIGGLNQKFNHLGIYFRVEDGIFSCSHTAYTEKEKHTLKPQQQQEKQIEVIQSNILYFGKDGQYPIGISFFSPEKYIKRHDIKVKIGSQERIFKPFSFKL